MTQGVNPMASVKAIADQIAQPIVRQRTRLLDAEDWTALRQYARLIAKDIPARPYIPALLSDEQWDADQARENRDWICDNG